MSSSRRLKRSLTRNASRAAMSLGVVGGLAGLTMAGPLGAAAVAQSDDKPAIINQETVQAKLDSAGKLEEARLYSQLTVLGDGTVKVLDPTSSKGLRDLDGFSAPLVRDGKAEYSIDVDGEERRRTVADFTGELPVTFQAKYELDGKEISAEDLVGKSGTLETTYTVVNRTAKPVDVTYKDGTGQEKTESVSLVTPYVGSLRLALPSQFRNVSGIGADSGGDGRGGSNLSWTLVLFDVIGSPAQRLTWTADVEDAELPPATLQVVPVDTNGNRVLQTSQTTIGEGAAAAAALTAGAFKIDGKVLEVRDGARKILDGLVQLEAGANALNAGLADTAAPGAQQLADGLGQAEAGGAKLAGGLDTLAAGNESLAQGLRSTTGADDLTGGAAKIAAGLVSVRDGVKTLGGAAGLPVASKGLQDLLFGLDHAPGTAGPADTGGLLQGLTAIAAGVSNPACDPNNPTNPANPCGIQQGLASVLNPTVGLPKALEGVTASKNDLTEKLKPLAEGGSLATLKAGADAVATGAAGLCAQLTALAGNADQELSAAAAGLKAAACDPKSATSPGLVLGSQGVAGGVQTVIDSTTASRDGLIQLEAGLKAAVAGLGSMKTGVDTRLAPGTAAARDAVKNQIVPGVQKLLAGVTGAVTGINGQLATGVDQLATGSGTLASKLGDAASGARKLADGSTTAATGSDDLLVGLGKLADGSTKLADGLGTAADGSGKLADGVTQVKDGVDTLQEGANRLSGEGTSLLAGSANTAATDNAKKTAILAAMAEQGKGGALPYGAPEGAIGDAAYSFVLAGANSDADENTTRGAAALALLALGSLGAFVIRRRVV